MVSKPRDAELYSVAQRIMAFCAEAGIAKVAQLFAWHDNLGESSLEQVLPEILLSSETEGDSKVTDPDFQTSGEAWNLIEQVTAKMLDDPQLIPHLRTLYECRANAMVEDGIRMALVQSDSKPDLRPFREVTADYFIGLVLQEFIWRHVISAHKPGEERNGYALLDVEQKKVCLYSEQFVKSVTTLEYPLDGSLPVVPLIPDANPVRTVLLALKRIEAIQAEYIQNGASDTEPDGVWQHHVAKAWRTAEPVHVTNTVQGWQLFRGTEGSEQAAERLCEATEACVKAIRNVPLGQKEELDRLLEKWLWRC